MKNRLSFGEFDADLQSGELRHRGGRVPIQDLPLRLLTALLERPGELVTRAELTERLWGAGTFVDATAGLNTAVAKLREALSDDPESPRYIETVPRRGYRFIGSIDPEGSQPPATAPSSDPKPRARWTLLAAAAAALAVVATVAYQRQMRGPTHVAVVLFDNETGDAALDRFSQGLTDAVVTELASESRLAVVGNAAVLRTARPFRDIAKVRDALGADYIVIGQVQQLDGGTIVRAHLIRARDQAHVWVNAIPRQGGSEAAFQSAVAGEVRAAVSEHALAPRR